MKHILNWIGISSIDYSAFPVAVPGNIQNDYANKDYLT